VSAPEQSASTAGAERSLAAAPAAGEVQPWTPPTEWSPGWQKLALDLVDPEGKLTPFETAYFFTRARALGLDPLARQVFPMKFKGGRMEPFVGIHGIRMLAERTRERGSERPFPIYDAEGRLTAVRVTVERVHGGKVAEFEFTAQMKEFFPKPGASGKVPDSWVDKPELMLTKCATANAYRAAFPEVLGGLYIAEEAGSE